MTTPSLKPIQSKEHSCSQGHYGDIVPELPMRSMLVGPSGSGKTVLSNNMILDIYKGCFSRAYIWSPSIEVDNTWKPVKDYIRDHIKPNDRETYYFDSYDPAELEQGINTQKKVIDYQKEQKHKDLYQIFIVTDDFADGTNFTRKSQLLHQLYTRGRHYMISAITPTQVYKQIRPIGRKNMTHLYIYRLRNYGDLEAIVEELGAIHDKKTLLQIYHEAVSEEYSFLYVNLRQKDKRKNVSPKSLKSKLKCFIFFLLYIMTTLDHSEGKFLTYTNEFIEAILLQLNSSNNYYTTGDDDIIFIKIGSDKALLLDCTYHINTTIFRIIQK